MFDSMFPSHWTTLRKLMWLKILNGGSAVWDTITGNPVSFSAKAAPLRQLKVAFSPKQDLHGYDAPWPAGGGKNKWGNGDVSVTAYSLIDFVKPLDAGSYVISAVVSSTDTDATTCNISFRDDSNATVATVSIDRSTGSTRVSKAFTLTGTAVKAYFYASNSSSHSEGDTASFDNIQIELGSTATSYAPYENVCPISGWTGVNVWDTGVNLWNPETAIEGFVASNGTFSVQSAAKEYRTDYVPVQKGATYVTLGYEDLEEGEQGWIGVGWFKSDKTFISRSNTTTSSKIASLGVPNNDEIAYAVFCTRTYGHGTTGLFATFGRSIPFSPFTGGQSISVQLGDTYYSGWADPTTGAGLATWAKSLLKDLSWSWFYKSAGILMADPPKANGKANLLFTSFKYSGSVQYHSLSNGEATGRDDAATIYVCNTAFAQSTIDNWLATLTDEDYVVYELETPIPFHVDPQAISSLEGTNTMWSNANGDLTATYRSN